MRYEKNRKIAGIDELKLQKIMKLMIIPIIVIVLVLVIVLADKDDDKETAAQTAASASATEPAAASQDETVNDQSAQPSQEMSLTPDDNLYVHDFDAGIQKNTVEAVSELIQKYQRAKITADAALMYEVFGRTDTEGMDALQTKLDSEKEAYECYENTEIYTVRGLEEDSYLAYVVSDVKFTGIDTPAPMLIWAYMVTSEDGTLYIKEPESLTAEESEYVVKISASEDVKLLDSQMRSELAEAVTSDAKLAALYEIWAAGSSDNDGHNASGTETETTDNLDPDIVVIGE